MAKAHLLWPIYIYIYVYIERQIYIYIYIYIDGQIDREILHTCTYIHLYTHTHTKSHAHIPRTSRGHGIDSESTFEKVDIGPFTPRKHVDQGHKTPAWGRFCICRVALLDACTDVSGHYVLVAVANRAQHVTRMRGQSRTPFTKLSTPWVFVLKCLTSIPSHTHSSHKSVAPDLHYLSNVMPPLATPPPCVLRSNLCSFPMRVLQYFARKPLVTNPMLVPSAISDVFRI